MEGAWSTMCSLTMCSLKHGYSSQSSVLVCSYVCLLLLLLLLLFFHNHK